MQFSISNKTRKKIPRATFEKIKDGILGKRYELSLVFCGNSLSRKLNLKFRGKDKPANILSFPLSKNSGEIFINLSKLGEFSPLHLFIHGLLHLKGMPHGARMNRVEKKWLVKSQSASI
ncbi:MAG: rRNA maturation RNase YbeY [Candidatus Zambryskibacteria bacterium RIFCSPHIGHO2_01_FULL_49_18]|uniref:Endoribonuclease YbeY n=2 Tax=Candidatus Zambryskiibacteriota TaxID=1817925 RepID=A0A1G2T237_9BACT|nr:MAG: rRNA maturation RNase YbeY [Candidatus Zambryskibacteria bacterium RIFCSPHIGHO2_01_FULL_49_18]OHB05128.1 MAG: rRNA maturation RNase YbeY [Candidatus Zambryskibacteria bacterium RIFCSPLOWO2_01_FULL_47_14]